MLCFSFMHQAQPLPCGHTRRLDCARDPCCPTGCQGHPSHCSCGLACGPLNFLPQRALDVFMSLSMDVSETVGILYIIFLIQDWRLFSNILLCFYMSLFSFPYQKNEETKIPSQYHTHTNISYEVILYAILKG